MKPIRFRRLFRHFVQAILLSAPVSAFAACPISPTGDRTLCVEIGTSFGSNDIIQRIVSFLATSILTIASVMFLVGAFMIVLAGAKEDFKQKGKDLMIGSMVSVGVVLGAYAIYRTVAHFLAFVQ